MKSDTRCGAKTRSGSPCKNRPMKNGRCRLHGGKSLAGEAHPNFKDGSRSKYLPQRLLAIYEDVEAHPEQQMLQRNIQLREAFMREKLVMLDAAPDSVAVWKNMRQELDGVHRAFANDDMGNASLALERLSRVVDERLIYLHTVAEIKDDMAEHRKDVQAIANIQYKGQNAVTVKELMVFMGGVLSVINAAVSDRNQRIVIHQGIDELFSRNATGVATVEAGTGDG